MKTRAQNQENDSRIKSIIKAHLLIFGSELLNFNLGSFSDYQDLVTFNERSPRSVIKRSLSILRANEAMLQEGLLSRKKGKKSEFFELENYLLSLLEVKKRELAGTNIVPQTLGLSFLRKGYGVPLFGYHRPEQVPLVPGVLLCYQSMAGDGIGRIDIFLLDSSSKIQYENLGVVMDSGCNALHCVIAEQTELSYPGTLIPEVAFAGKKNSTYTFNTRVAVLSEVKNRYKIKNQIYDPLHYQYPYFFIADAYLSTNITRFLLDLFLGSFGFRERDVEPLVLEIIQKAL